MANDNDSLKRISISWRTTTPPSNTSRSTGVAASVGATVSTAWLAAASLAPVTAALPAASTTAPAVPPLKLRVKGATELAIGCTVTVQATLGPEALTACTAVTVPPVTVKSPATSPDTASEKVAV